MKTEMKTDAIVVISDIHAGSRLGLFPPGRKKILRGSNADDYITVNPSPFQRWLWKMWQEFWNEF
ncbi:hypothetical protein, partial [Thermogutta sp.]|uniref:hypothetical protein n=1 Tax=Thermogutta sp. TaxID=1962930 RepID=UPI003220A106